jgi:hypothetical protein
MDLGGTRYMKRVCDRSDNKMNECLMFDIILLVFNNTLSLNYSIKCFDKKVSYTFLRLYPVLKKVRF